MSEHTPNTTTWPYAERNGVGVEGDVTTLLASPEIELDAHDMLAARAFAQDLFDGNAPDFMRDDHEVDEEPYCDQTLGQIYQTSIASKARQYYAGYFESPVGGGEAFGGGMSIDERSLATRSVAWYKRELSARLVGNSEDDSNWPDSPVIFEHTDPAALLDKFQNLQQYREFYREVSRELRLQPSSDLVTAQQTLLTVYRSRVNSMTAELYPVLLSTADWLDQQPDNAAYQDLKQQIAEVVPIAGNIYAKTDAERQKYMEQFAWRMDYIRNGAARQADGSLSPVSPELATLADELDGARGESSRLPRQLSPELLDEMKDVHWGAAELQTFLSTVLKDWGLLGDGKSSWKEVQDRSGPHAEGGWQVVLGTVGSLEVNGTKKVMVVPEKFNQMSDGAFSRQLIKVLAVAAHELAHVQQSEFDAVTAEQVPLAAVKGKQYITNRELGGIYEERALLAMAGQDRPTNTTYVRAMQAKVAGGNQTQVARAYADVHSARTPQARASAAGKNIMRLYRPSRRGGHDSQVLDYAEQELVLRGFSGLPEEEVARIAVTGGSFSLRDAAALHRVGLLELPKAAVHRTSEEVMRIYLSQFHGRTEQ